MRKALDADLFSINNSATFTIPFSSVPHNPIALSIHDTTNQVLVEFNDKAEIIYMHGGQPGFDEAVETFARICHPNPVIKMNFTDANNVTKTVELEKYKAPCFSWIAPHPLTQLFFTEVTKKL